MPKKIKLKTRSLKAWRKVLNLILEGYTIIIEPDEGMENSYTLSLENTEKNDFSHTHCGRYVEVINSETKEVLIDQLLGDILHDRPSLAWYKSKINEV